MSGRVVITGAAGFLGQNLARHLAAAGVPLTLISPHPDAALAALPGVTFVPGRAEEVLGQVDLGGCLALLHLAATTHTRRGDPADEQTQLEVLRRVLERTAPAGLPVLFPSSGGTVYGEGSEAPHREDHPLAPTSEYARGKVQAEQAIAAAAGPYKILRCANPYGPWQSLAKRQGLVLQLLADLQAGRTTEIWGDGQETRDYFFVGDLGPLIEALLAAPSTSGVFNVGSGRGHSVNQVVELVAEAVGRRPSVTHVAGVASALRRNVLDPDKTAQAFGWRTTTSLLDGIRQTWDWLQAAGTNGRPGP